MLAAACKRHAIPLFVISLLLLSGIFIVTNIEFGNSAEAIDTGVPSPPRNLTVARNVKTIILNWSSPEFEGKTELRKFVIERSQDGVQFSTWTRVESQVRTYNMMEHFWGEVNYFRIMAENDNGTSQPSNIGSILMANRPYEPNSFGTSPRNGYVELTWHPPIDDGGVPITEYHVIKTLDVNDHNVTAVLDHSVLKYIDHDVEPGIYYNYTVRAFNIVGGSPYPRFQRRTPFSPPFEPIDLSYYKIDDKLVLQWKMPSYLGGGKLAKFHVLRGPTSDLLREYSLKSPDEFVHTLYDHPLGEGYYYAITAENEFGVSPQSNMVFVRPVGVPGNPTNLVARYRIDHVRLAWEPPIRNGGSNITSYNIYRSSDSDSDEDSKVLIATVPWGVTSYIDDDEKIGDGDHLIYYVHPVNEYGEGAYDSHHIYAEADEEVWIFLMVLLGILIAPAGIFWLISGLTHGKRMKSREKRALDRAVEKELSLEKKDNKIGENPPLTENDREEMKTILEGMK